MCGPCVVIQKHFKAKRNLPLNSAVGNILRHIVKDCDEQPKVDT